MSTVRCTRHEPLAAAGPCRAEAAADAAPAPLAARAEGRRAAAEAGEPIPRSR